MGTLLEIVRWTALSLQGLFARARVRLLRRDALVASTEAMFRALLETAPDAMVIVDGHGHIKLINAQTARIFGWTRGEIVGQSIAELMPQELHAGHRIQMERYFADPAPRSMGAGLDQVGRRKDGSLFPVEISLGPLQTDSGPLVCAAIRDVSARKRAESHESLRLVATLVATGAEPHEVFTAVAKQITQLLDATQGRVVRLCGPSGVGETVGGWNAGGATAEIGIELPGPRVTTVDHHPGVNGQQIVGAPIFVDGKLWGSAEATFAPGARIAPGSAERLARFAELVAVAIANAHTREMLVHQAGTDTLTGLANHRVFHEHLDAECARAARHGLTLSVALFDIDHFKAVNDNHGHQTGDVVLAEVAARLLAATRGGELVARTGGEEFAWLMPEISLDGAYTAAERARCAIESAPFARVGMLTVSVGVCSNEHTDETAPQMFHAADRALYAAKDRGRNRTCTHELERGATLLSRQHSSV